MNKLENLTLIDGVFSHDEAKEILNSIFSSKIKFHNLKNFSSQERFGKDDDIAKNRIPALKNEILKFENILSEAKNKNIVIKSEISISILGE